MNTGTYWKLLKLTYAAWEQDEAARRGAALAFYSILSLGPLLLLVLVVAASIWGQEAAQGQIVGQMSSLIGTQGAAAIETVLTSTSENKEGGVFATIFGIVMLIFAASGVFGELQDAMNAIWNIPPRKGRPIMLILRERFLSATMVLGTAFL